MLWNKDEYDIKYDISLYICFVVNLVYLILKIWSSFYYKSTQSIMDSDNILEALDESFEYDSGSDYYYYLAVQTVQILIFLVKMILPKVDFLIPVLKIPNSGIMLLVCICYKL